MPNKIAALADVMLKQQQIKRKPDFVPLIYKTGLVVVEPFIIAVNSLPRVALGPLIVMFVGIGLSSKRSSVILVSALIGRVY